VSAILCPVYQSVKLKDFLAHVIEPCGVVSDAVRVTPLYVSVMITATESVALVRRSAVSYSYMIVLS
jgi:hypothetical protein